MTSSAPDQKTTPDEAVEAMILAALPSSAAASEESIKALRGKLSQGAIKAEDWTFIFTKQISSAGATTDEA